LLTALVCTALLAAPVPVQADAPRAKKLVIRPAADIAVTASFGVGILLSETAFKRYLAPTSCRWCATNAYDLAISNVRAPLALQPVADIASSVTLIATPALVVGINMILASQSGATLGDGVWDVMLVAEAVLSAALLQQTVKFAVGRERPFVYRLAPEDKPNTLHPEDNNLSFFSGHTEFTFAAAMAAGTIAKLRGYKYWWLAYAVGLPLAALTGFLRMSADKHWFSDVLIGAAVGSAAGWFIPTLFHGREEDGGLPRVMVAPMPLGLAVSVRLD
jgi:membrane-associated phospholipid phosphatase